MVTEAAQTEASFHAAQALVDAYNGLVTEVFAIMDQPGLADLKREAMGLFQVLGSPPGYSPVLQAETTVKLQIAASAAILRLRTLGGWIQGLIDELTLEQRMRIEAEEKAKAEARPGVGFRG